MAPQCREFGISRVTGYKIFDRYKDGGVDGLNDRSRAPYRQANKLPFQIERRKRRRHKASGTALIGANSRNGLWYADYKGEFMLGNREYCYSLTITDYRSRYLITCEGVPSTRSDFALSILERAFKDFGLLHAIRTDSGVPLASGNALFGLTKLSLWWLRLSIQIQRIKPGHPEQNGRHERKHLTLKKEATKPAAFNFLQQQERFDNFIGVYNNKQPHRALGGAYPGDIYTPSPRVNEPPPDPEYPYHDRSVRVTRSGRICLSRRKINLSSVFAGQTIGIREVDDQIWLVSFLEYDLGYFDEVKGPGRTRSLALPATRREILIANRSHLR